MMVNCSSEYIFMVCDDWSVDVFLLMYSFDVRLQGLAVVSHDHKPLHDSSGKQATIDEFVHGCLFGTHTHGCMPIMHSNMYVRCEEAFKRRP